LHAVQGHLESRLANFEKSADIGFVKRFLTGLVRRRWSDTETDRYHAESRTRVAKLQAEGRGAEALAESTRQLGIDTSKVVKSRLISLNGVRLKH